MNHSRDLSNHRGEGDTVGGVASPYMIKKRPFDQRTLKTYIPDEEVKPPLRDIQSSPLLCSPRQIIQPTSRETYHELLASGKVENQELKILEQYRRHPEGLTDAEMAVFLNIPRSTVSARRNGLNKKNVVFLEKNNRAIRHLIINENKETRLNPGINSKKGLVWRLNYRRR